ncbi:MAG: hypothetical protein VKK80_05645 [Prochlorothrix sp.]|nr:hypothetical protein [Prochlorothrix sp.]
MIVSTDEDERSQAQWPLYSRGTAFRDLKRACRFITSLQALLGEASTPFNRGGSIGLTVDRVSRQKDLADRARGDVNAHYFQG